MPDNSQLDDFDKRIKELEKRFDKHEGDNKKDIEILKKMIENITPPPGEFARRKSPSGGHHR